MTNRLGHKSIAQRLGNPTAVAFLVTIVVWMASSLLIDGFATFAHNVQFAQTAIYLGFMAAGQALVVTSGGFDLSISSVVTLSSVIASAMAQRGHGPLLSVGAALGASMLVGLFNASGITFLRIPPMIMTLATVSLLEGILLLATNGTPPSGVNDLLVYLAKGQLIPSIPNVILIYLGFIAVAIWFVMFSRWGRAVYAIGTNEKASWLSGIQVVPMKFMLYAICSLCAGISGVLMLGYMGSTYLTIGAPYQMFTVAATVMGGISIAGGKGSYVGIIAGTFLFTAIRDILTVAHISPAGRELFQGLMILLVILAYGREKRQR